MYIVPGMKLIPQQRTGSCWYACAQMLIHWRQERSQMSHLGLIPPELDAECQRLLDKNSGITNPQIVPMAKRLGLEVIPPMSIERSNLRDLLKTYGPLWVNGVKHITVIAGVYKYSPKWEARQILMYDPSPVGVGKVGWFNFQMRYEQGSAWHPDRRDTHPSVEATFLHCPQVYQPKY